MTKLNFLKNLGLEKFNSGVSTGAEWLSGNGTLTESVSPTDSSVIANVQNANREDYETLISKAQQAFPEWRKVPAPQRGDIVRQIGNAVREAKDDLGKLVSWEMGKIYQEGLGEVQEMIDICDFAVGLSRQLYGSTMHSERPGHRMYDQYHPLGIVGIISAFNFPVAVWSWNAMIAAVCGNVSIWKPSPKTPLCSIALQRILGKVLRENGIQEGVFNLVIGTNEEIAETLVNDKRVPLISATGSTEMGRKVSAKVASRLGRSILELGGNNAIIVTESADLKIAIPGIVFGSVGTCGQRCTTTRRIIIHESIYEDVKNKLIQAYSQLENRVGDPLDSNTLIGPMIDEVAVNNFRNALEEVRRQGGKLIYGGDVLEGHPSNLYVRPALAEVENHWTIVQDETFAPLLYLIRYQNFDEALCLQNDVPQGLSSAVFTRDFQQSEKFLSHEGSDCGLANINIGTSGAEIGGAFGGEKDTGGGRESGSDAWKSYMRRQTNTINYSSDLPLAQGVSFDLG
ncbi:MAG: aldehyde dehydrogenase family protein [SAR324 cluster bacterium]|jgi:aldehyde dehydrogenase (NAD+)|nr:aldehyde dehydrogenase family protein [SAR324 cluster bacterium]